ncbi:MAG: PAS domain S-box protein [Chloroflexota bacterium]|nr:PAS domain S-box protein [Chloroflexota bacterium]
MADMTLEAGPAVSSRWTQWAGPLVTLATLLIIEALSQTVLVIPNPAPIYLMAVVYAAFVGGLLPGLVSAGLTFVYALYFFATPGQLLGYTPDNLARIFVLAIVAPAMAVLVGILKQRVMRGQMSRTAAERTQQQLNDVAAQHLKELQDQQRWLETILNVMPTPLLLIEPGTARVRFANKAADRLAGGTFPKDAPAEDYHQVYYCTYPNGERIRDEEMPGVRAARGERLEHFEMDWQTPTGKLSLIVQSETLPAIHGHDAMAVVSFQDVTPVKRAESLSARLGRVLDQSSNEIYIFDATTLRYIQANQGARHNLGYTMDELAALTPLDLKPAYTAPQFDQLLAPLRNGEREQIVFETLHQRKAGTRYPVEVRLQLSHAEEPPVFVAITQDITARVRSEAALRESEARFRVMADNAPVLLWMTDTTGSCTFFNQQWLDFTGRNLAQELGEGWLTGVHPEDRERNERSFLQAIHAREKFRMEYRLRRADGQYRWVLDTGAPLFGDDGTFAGYIGSCVDLTERHQLETALKQKTIEQEVLLNSMPAVVYYKDRDCRYVAVNQAFAELTQQPLDAIPGKTDFELFAHEEASAYRRDDLAVMESGQPLLNIEEPIISADGSTMWVASHKTPYRDPQGHVAGLVGISTDISVRKQVEQELRTQTETLAMVNRVGQILSAELDLQKLVQAVTDAATTLTAAAFGAFFYNVNNEHGESYTLYTLSGVDRAAFAQFPMPRNTHVFGPTFRNEGIMRVDDITKDPRYGQNPPFAGMPAGHLPVASYMAIPVVSRTGDVLGGLFFGHPEPGRFTEREEQIIVGLVAQATVAMDNARLYQAEQLARQAAERATERVGRLQAITAALAEALTTEDVAEVIVAQGIPPLGAYAGSVALLAPDGEALEIIRSVGYGAAVMREWGRFPLNAPVPLAESVRTGEPIWLSSPEDYQARYPNLTTVTSQTQSQAIVSLPLLSAGRAIGSLGFSFAKPQDFTADDQAFMLALARQCTQALVRAQLYESERQARAGAEAAEREKEKARALLDTLFQAAPVGLGFLDQELRYQRINEALATINGLSAAEHLGRPIKEVLPDIPEPVLVALRQVLTTGEPIVNREVAGETRTSLGQRRYWLSSYYQVPGQYGEAQGIGAVVQEITERKRAEEAQRFIAEATALLVASLDYKTTLQNVARLAVPRLADWCAVDMVEDDGTPRRVAVIHVNPAKVELALELQRRFPTDPQAPRGLGAVIRNGRSELTSDIPDELLVSVAPNQEWLELVRPLGLASVMIVPLTTGGRTLGAITFASAESGRHFDAADLALAEELGRRAAVAVDNARLYQDAQEAILARDDFLSIASHELKTPITALQLQAQSLLRLAQKGDISRLSPERLITKLQLVDEQTSRLTHLTNDLLDVARIRTGRIDFRPEEFDLAQVVREVVARFDEQLALAGCAVSLQAPMSISIWSDRSRLEQIITNLLTNAIKYGAGKPITLLIEQEQGVVRLVVRDQGIGIAPEHLERIFVRFERAVSSRNYGGLGLGLYIVRQIVEALGGTIRVTSEVGVGSTFVVTLPLISVPN